MQNGEKLLPLPKQKKVVFFTEPDRRPRGVFSPPRPPTAGMRARAAPRTEKAAAPRPGAACRAKLPARNTPNAKPRLFLRTQTFPQ